MKTKSTIYKVFMTIFLLMAFSTNVHSQILKKLKKRAEKAAERTIERRVDKETQEKTDEVLDSILEPGSKNPTPKSQNPEAPNVNKNEEQQPLTSSKSGQKAFQYYTNYDFVPGDRLILYDDFSEDQVGDFPAKWNTNGSGEVVTLNDSPDKWLKLSDRTTYIPDLSKVLPEDFTLEFDMMTTGLDMKVSSTARLRLLLDENNTFKQGINYAEISIPMAQYIDAGIYVKNYYNGQSTIRNFIKKDVRNDIIDFAHIAIAVNGNRFRMWINERKLVDLPRFLEPGLSKHVKFDINQMPSETKGQFVFITNVKLAEGGEDVRSKLLKDGMFSTTGILFDSGSDQIKPESYGVLKKIAEALQLEANMNIEIIGHTDADGAALANLQLSKDRAANVSKVLSEEFDIDEGRLHTDGKGENEPVGDNSTPEGKAQNRRVQFIKMS